MAIKIIALATIVALAAAESNEKMIQKETDHHLDIPHDYYAYPKYSFDYGVKDFKTGDYKMHKEERDGDSINGEYSVADPDGTIRTVTYTVTKHGGFQAVVQKSGGTDQHEYKAEEHKAPIVQEFKHNGSQTGPKYGQVNSRYQQSYQDVLEKEMEEKKVVEKIKKNVDAYKNHEVKQIGGQSEERSSQYQYGHANSEYQQRYQDVLEKEMEEKKVVDMIKKNMDAYKNREEMSSYKYKYPIMKALVKQQEKVQVIQEAKKDVPQYKSDNYQIHTGGQYHGYNAVYEKLKQKKTMKPMKHKMMDVAMGVGKDFAPEVKEYVPQYKADNYQIHTGGQYHGYGAVDEKMKQEKIMKPLKQEKMKKPMKHKVLDVAMEVGKDSSPEVDEYLPQYKSEHYQIHNEGQYHGYKAVDEKMKQKKIMNPMKHRMMDVAMEVGKDSAAEVYVPQYKANNYQSHTGGQYYGYKAVDEKTNQEKIVQKDKTMMPMKHKMMDVAMKEGKDSAPEAKEYVPQYKLDNYQIHTRGQYHGYKAVDEKTKQVKIMKPLKQEKMRKPMKHKMMDVTMEVEKVFVPQVKEYVPQYKSENYQIHTGGQYHGYEAVDEKMKQEKIIKPLKQEKMMNPMKHKILDMAMEVETDSSPEVNGYVPQYKPNHYQIHNEGQYHGHKAVDEKRKQKKMMKPMKHKMMEMAMEIGKDTAPEVKEYVPQYNSNHYQIHNAGQYHGYKAIDEKRKQEKVMRSMKHEKMMKPMKHKMSDVALDVEKDYEQKHYYIPDYYQKNHGDY